MKLKIICSAFLFCISLTLFAGCASANTVATVYLDGSRSYFYSINLDKEVLASYEIDTNKVVNFLSNTAQNYEEALVNYALTNNRSMDGVSIKYGLAKGSQAIYEFEMSFASFKSYCNFYGITQEDLDNQKADIKEGVFVSQSIIVDSNIDSPEKLVRFTGLNLDWDSVVNEFSAEFFNNDKDKTLSMFNKIKCNVIRCYPTSSNFKSNADYTSRVISKAGVTEQQETSYTAHLWECTLDSPTPHYYIYTNVVTAHNRLEWYLLAGGITLLFGAILSVFLILKQKKRQALLKELFDALLETEDKPSEFKGPYTKEELFKLAKQRNIDLEKVLKEKLTISKDMEFSDIIKEEQEKLKIKLSESIEENMSKNDEDSNKSEKND